MRRRQFIALLGGVAAMPLAAVPLAAWAQQSEPLLGLISSGSRDSMAPYLQAFHLGLGAAGYSEGKNLRIEYRWADEQTSRLPALAADLVDQGVGAITAIGSPSVVAAQRATVKIPIVFYVGVDPVAFRFVASLNRPGGNLTGVANFSLEVGPKLIQMLHELLPSATSIALMINPTSPAAESNTAKLRNAANAIGIRLDVVHASSDADFEPVFASLVQRRVAGLMIGGDPFFNSRTRQLGALALQHGLPAIYQTREFAVAGGLMSYGSSFAHQYRTLGEYTGRILNGETPADLPVQQPTTVELIVNLNTAKALGLEIPAALLARADEVIE
jgi:ABC-type uncharacterized transport system substrate-binding protein